MADKKALGSFIKTKRTEKNYSPKDLAEMLFISAVLFVIGFLRVRNLNLSS